MTTVFVQRAPEGVLLGFCLEGHSGYAEAGGDIVCAALTSAVRLTECALTDVLGLDTRTCVQQQKTRISVKLTPEDAAKPAAQTILAAFLLHMKALAGEYEAYIKVMEESVC